MSSHLTCVEVRRSADSTETAIGMSTVCDRCVSREDGDKQYAYDRSVSEYALIRRRRFVML